MFGRNMEVPSLAEAQKEKIIEEEQEMPPEGESAPSELLPESLQAQEKLREYEQHYVAMRDQQQRSETKAQKYEKRARLYAWIKSGLAAVTPPAMYTSIVGNPFGALVGAGTFSGAAIANSRENVNSMRADSASFDANKDRERAERAATGGRKIMDETLIAGGATEVRRYAENSKGERREIEPRLRATEEQIEIARREMEKDLGSREKE